MNLELSTTTTVAYTEDALVITLPTGCPATLHRSLMQGLTTSMRLHILSDEKLACEADGLAALASLLDKLIPTVDVLEKGAA